MNECCLPNRERRRRRERRERRVGRLLTVSDGGRIESWRPREAARLHRFGICRILGGTWDGKKNLQQHAGC